MLKELMPILETASLRMKFTRNGEQIVVRIIPDIVDENDKKIPFTPVVLSGKPEDIEEKIEKDVVAAFNGLTLNIENINAFIESVKQQEEAKKKDAKKSTSSAKKSNPSKTSTTKSEPVKDEKKEPAGTDLFEQKKESPDKEKTAKKEPAESSDEKKKDAVDNSGLFNQGDMDPDEEF